MTDDWDRRCLMSILENYYNSEVVNPQHVYSESGVYHQLSPEINLEVCVPGENKERRRRNHVFCTPQAPHGDHTVNDNNKRA